MQPSRLPIEPFLGQVPLLAPLLPGGRLSGLELTPDPQLLLVALTIELLILLAVAGLPGRIPDRPRREGRGHGRTLLRQGRLGAAQLGEPSEQLLAPLLTVTGEPELPLTAELRLTGVFGWSRTANRGSGRRCRPAAQDADRQQRQPQQARSQT